MFRHILSTKKILFAVFLFSLVFSTSLAFASSGVIDPSATNHALVCHDVSCTSPIPGIINFELEDEPSIVIDSVTGISGMVWGNELGWINMNPTGEGVTFENVHTGLLTGRAWSQVSGWINFNVTGQHVIIDPDNGKFQGFAWASGPYGGWVKFDCGDSSTCVRTTWRHSSSGSSGGGRVGGGAGGTIDVCPNIIDNQESIPNGFMVTPDGSCVPAATDKCPNLLGIQTTVPPQYTLNNIGACIFTAITPTPAPTPTTPPPAASIDYCPNIPNTQATVPEGYFISGDGDCSVIEEDLCANLFGVQSLVPNGFSQEGENCFYQEETVQTPSSGEGSTSAPTTEIEKQPLVTTLQNKIGNMIAKLTMNQLYFLLFWIILLLLLIVYYLSRRRA